MTDGSRYRRMLKAVLSGTAARLLSSGVGLLSLPLAVRYLGPERYGVWATITTTAAWVNLLDLGIANTLTNQISRAYARDDRQAAGRYFTNALLLSISVITVVGLAFAFFFSRVKWSALFNVTSRVSTREVALTVAVAAALMLIAIPCNLAAKIFAGYQELHLYNYGYAIGVMASLAGLTLGVLTHVAMPALYLISLGCITYSSAGMLIVLVCRRPWLLPRKSHIEAGVMRDLLASGSSFFLIQVAAVVVFSSDNLIVGHYLGAAEVTPYSVTWRLAGVAAMLQSLTFPALWPAYSEAYAKGDYGWVRRTFSTTLKGVVALNILCAIGLVLFGRALIRLWAGPAAVPTRNLIVAMSVWVILNGFMSMESCLLAALNRTREQAVLSTVAAALNVALSIFLVRRIGAIGVIGGTVISYLAVLVVPQSLIVRGIWRRELQAKPRQRLSLDDFRRSLFTIWQEETPASQSPAILNKVH